MTFITPVNGDEAIAEHVAQLTETLSGTRAIPVSVQTLNVATKPVVISPDAGNTLAWQANGLFVPTPAAGGVTLPLTQHLTFSPDNTYDIGATGATRPRIIYAGTSVYAATSVVTPIVDTGAAASLLFRINGSTKWQISVIDSSFRAGTDNTVDIGAVGANRPRHIYAANGITNSGNMGIGGSVAGNAGLYLTNTALTGTSQYGLYANPTFASSATTAGEAIRAAFQTAASAFTMTNGYGVRANAPTIGAGSAVTTMHGVRVENQGVAAVANAYGIYIAAQSGAATTNVGLYNAGTTQLVGDLTLGGVINLPSWGVGNGAAATALPAVKGTGYGPTSATGNGWIPFVLGGTTVYVPYYV